jgi:hypothetical protein
MSTTNATNMNVLDSFNLPVLYKGKLVREIINTSSSIKINCNTLNVPTTILSFSGSTFSDSTFNNINFNGKISS